MVDFEWSPQPAAARLVAKLCDVLCSASTAARELARRMHEETGTRLIDWLDHLALPATSDGLAQELIRTGFEPQQLSEGTLYRQPRGLFPPILLHADQARRLAVRIDSVDDFVAAWPVEDTVKIEELPQAAHRRARVATEGDTELWVEERHGYPGFAVPDLAPHTREALQIHSAALQQRQREFSDPAEGFAQAGRLVEAAAADLGMDWACDLFFAAEREYWQRRNIAAQVQYARQQTLGLGWANHDHHTYRSSREQFARLISVLELMGFHCRERFFAGREAGWGAQVLEQPQAGVVVFADVDLDADEVAGDFAHQPLPPRKKLGTVGLWCRLHGEAFLQAGMHHLECRFDYEQARAQLKTAGIETMQPFTDFPYLKQAFTKGEMWPVDPQRLSAAEADGAITAAEAETFRQRGALGSHLEILQRDDGYKGFNQTGISDIIRRTDPRSQGNSPPVAGA
ncbi:MAG: hypothetical protein K8T91_08265 [Planctomycetes bacterium]|nr:hypothetical protein [Planctomycetota bacterium]